MLLSFRSNLSVNLSLVFIVESSSYSSDIYSCDSLQLLASFKLSDNLLLYIAEFLIINSQKVS